MAKSVEKILLKYDPKKENILPALKEISAVFGLVEEESARKAAAYFCAPESKIYETASFYDLIDIKKNPPLVIKVCSSANCALNNSLKIMKEIENFFKIKAGDDFHPKVKLELMSCLGRCDEGPVVSINEKIFTRVTVSSLYVILEKYI